MSTNNTISTLEDLESTPATAVVPEQLSLLAGSVPLQFRLDERTRRSGLQHVAQLREQMIAQAAARRTRPQPFAKPTKTPGTTAATTRSGGQIAA